MLQEQDHQIAETVAREQGRLRNFVRSWVPDEADAEDILQDVFFELVEAYRLAGPLREAGAWMFRVARNRITDLFRRRQTRGLPAVPPAEPETGEPLALEAWLPSLEAGPDGLLARRILRSEWEAALDELPPEQRDVFLAHEWEGHSFNELARRTGLGVNTLLSRKHYAVLHLRRRLRAAYDAYKEYRNV